MAIIIGLVLLALGISLAVGWWQQFLFALQGLTVVSLLLWGGIMVLVGYSEMKAKREFSDALNRDPEAASEAVAESGTSTISST